MSTESSWKQRGRLIRRWSTLGIADDGEGEHGDGEETGDDGADDIGAYPFVGRSGYILG